MQYFQASGNLSGNSSRGSHLGLGFLKLKVQINFEVGVEFKVLNKALKF